MLIQSRLQEMLHYNHKTGIFTRKIATGGTKIGDIANHVMSTGYIFISVDGKQYLAHRLAFLYMEGYWPEPQVDHINGIRTENRWENLRQVSQSCNNQNLAIRSDNRSGFPGVHFEKSRRKWIAQICVNQQQYNIGRHNTALEAALARFTAEVQCPDWTCNYRSELVKRIKHVWPDFHP